MNLSRRVRRLHRWISIVFTASVLANFIAMMLGRPAAWVTYAPLAPLAVLLMTGLYLFGLPYLTTGRRRK
jgi:uncharacterized membrane protein AbrB (regulator of aidB expression)